VVAGLKMVELLNFSVRFIGVLLLTAKISIEVLLLGGADR
jgi:hypothetical protein